MHFIMKLFSSIKNITDFLTKSRTYLIANLIFACIIIIWYKICLGRIIIFQRYSSETYKFIYTSNASIRFVTTWVHRNTTKIYQFGPAAILCVIFFLTIVFVSQRSNNIDNGHDNIAQLIDASTWMYSTKMYIQLLQKII